MASEEKRARQRAACKRWRAKNPGKQAKLTAEWRERNPGASEASRKRWVAKNPGRDATNSKAWRSRNPGGAYRATKSWMKRNPAKVKDTAARRRAARVGVDEWFTPYQKGRVKKQFGRKCVRCGSIKKLCLDHHLPLSKGFALDYGNAVVLCLRCNSSKRDKLPEDFYTQEELSRVEAFLAVQRTWKQPPSKLLALKHLNKSW